MYKLENPPPEEDAKDLTSAKSRRRPGSIPKDPEKPEEPEEIKKAEEIKEKDAKKLDTNRGKPEKPKKKTLKKV